MDFGVFKINGYMVVKQLDINDTLKESITAQNIKFSNDSLICNKDWVYNVLLPKIKESDFRYLKKDYKDTLINIFTSDILEKYTIFAFYIFSLDSGYSNAINMVGENYRLTITYDKELPFCVFDITMYRLTFSVRMKIDKGKCEADNIEILMFDLGDFDV